MQLETLRPGTRIKVGQHIRRRGGDWIAEVEGEFIEWLTAPTGSWYAHGKDDRYWLTRLKLRKSNGEVSLLTLDADSEIIVLDGEPSREG